MCNQTSPTDAMCNVTDWVSNYDFTIVFVPKNHLTIVAGRPSTGKTNLAIDVVVHSARRRDDTAIIYFSVELSPKHLYDRISDALKRCDDYPGILEKRQWKERDHDTLILELNNGTSIHIDATPDITPEAIRSRCLAIDAMDDNSLGLVIVDYLQLVRPDDGQVNGKDLSGITASLKALSQEIRVPVVVLSQLPRTAEHREDKRPTQADLEPFGPITDHADLVVFTHKDLPAYQATYIGTPIGEAGIDPRLV